MLDKIKNPDIPYTTKLDGMLVKFDVSRARMRVKHGGDFADYTISGALLAHWEELPTYNRPDSGDPMAVFINEPTKTVVGFDCMSLAQKEVNPLHIINTQTPAPTPETATVQETAEEKQPQAAKTEQEELPTYVPRPVRFHNSRITPDATFDNSDLAEFRMTVSKDPIEYPAVIDGYVPYAPSQLPLILLAGASASGKSMFALHTLLQCYLYRQMQNPGKRIFMVYLSTDATPDLVIQEARKAGFSDELLEYLIFPRNRLYPDHEENRFFIDNQAHMGALKEALDHYASKGIIAGVVIDALSTVLQKTKITDSEIATPLRELSSIGTTYEAPVFLISHTTKDQLKNATLNSSPEFAVHGSVQIAAQCRHLLKFENSGERRTVTVVKTMSSRLFPERKPAELLLRENEGLDLLPMLASPSASRVSSHTQLVFDYLTAISKTGVKEISMKELCAWGEQNGLSAPTVTRATELARNIGWVKVTDHLLGKNAKKLLYQTAHHLEILDRQDVKGGN